MLGRNRDAPVHVVYHPMTLQDLAFLLFRQRVEDRAQLTPYASADRFAPSFGHEYDRVLAVPLGVG
jgi:hypothetical protein